MIMVIICTECKNEIHDRHYNIGKSDGRHSWCSNCDKDVLTKRVSK